MEVVTLGTAAGSPTVKRNVQSAAVRLASGRTVIVDCGEGTQQQIMKHNQTHETEKIRNIQAVLITHLHGDHVFGLPGLMCFIDAAGGPRTPLRVVGPRGLRAYLRVTLGLSRTELPARGYFVVELLGGPDDTDVFSFDVSGPPHPSERADLSHDVAFSGGGEKDELSWRGLFQKDDIEIDVDAAPIDHAGIPCVAYAIAEKPRLGKIDAAKVRAAAQRANDDPKRIFAALKNLLHSKDSVFDLKDGSTFDLTEAFVHATPVLRGPKVVVFGDCRGTRREPALRLAQNADLILHEATFDADLADLAFQRGHSTTCDAGRLARDVGAPTLVLWHFSHRYAHPDQSWVNTFTQQATTCRRHADDTDLPFNGTVLLAEDFDHFPVVAAKKKPDETV